LPGKFLFSTPIPIRIGDINRANHLSHVNLVQIIEEARAQFLTSIGFGNEVKIQQGLGFIVGDLAVVFKGQAHYGQMLQVEIGVIDLTEKSFDIVYKVSIATSGTEIATAKTGIIMFDYQAQRVTTIPADLRNKLIN
jgi:acyl-CoA thioester hydrolase